MKYIFLDLDDTIFDFKKAEEIALRKTLSEFKINADDREIARYSSINQAQWELLQQGKLTRDEVKFRRFSIFLEGTGVDPVPVANRYQDNLAIGHYFMDGAEELLSALHGKYKLYLASNGTKRVQMQRLASANILPLFDGVFLSEELGYEKPSPLFFEKAFASIRGFEKSEAVIVGDSLSSDVLGGKQAGIKTIWFSRDGESDLPDYTIRALSELPSLLENI
ncbi:MAG: YjjG family noncanonical pyrimidine nucleotidase [Clostridia bacterium]|nr:YjjG family noncanonical pyrimidine nucleotidase [Clostridia bacterium]